MPATDTAPQPDTTPPSPAAAGKGGKGGAASKAPTAPPAVATPEAPTEPGATAEDAATEPEPPQPEPGWFRNTAATDLTVIPDQYPSKKLAPAEATWLPDDPRHPNLERCDAPAPAADLADTPGSEQ